MEVWKHTHSVLKTAGLLENVLNIKCASLFSILFI
jgi:hypothetical protein